MIGASFLSTKYTIFFALYGHHLSHSLASSCLGLGVVCDFLLSFVAPSFDVSPWFSPGRSSLDRFLIVHQFFLLHRLFSHHHAVAELKVRHDMKIVACVCGLFTLALLLLLIHLDAS